MTPPHRLIHPAVSTAGAAALLTLQLFALPGLQARDVSPSPSSSSPSDSKAAVSSKPPETINWREEYNAAFFEAKEAKRLLWIQFTGPWCPSCARMERDSFPMPAVVGIAKKSFVAVKLRSDMNEDLAARLNLTGLPATIVIDPTDQSVLMLQQGFLGPDELVSAFGQTLDRNTKRLQDNEKLLADRGKKKESTEKEKEKPAADQVAKAEEKPKTDEPKVAEESGPKPGLEGYCPVSLVLTHKLLKGKSEFTVTHDGRAYHLASAKLVEKFRENPERFVPTNGGLCPVRGVDQAVAEPGHPRFGVVYEDRLYLCASKDDRGQFLNDPERYARAHVEEQGYCPHCSRQEGVLVLGHPRYGAFHSDREYWFPDETHRQAFLSSLPTEGRTTR